MEHLTYPVNLLVEGPTDEVVARRLLEYVGLTCGVVYGKTGKAALLERLPKYNQAARVMPWLAVVDLDQEPECAPLLIRATLPDPAPGMRFRVAVRAIEAWLLADIEQMAAFLAVPQTKVPPNPDIIADPRALLVDLARQSRRRVIREDMVPTEGSKSRVGPGYPGRLIEFVTAADHRWRPEVAQRHSPSLRSCLEALQTLKRWQPEWSK